MSYTDTLATDRDRLRFLIGDTDSSDEILVDNELDYLLTQENLYDAAATAAQAIAAEFSRQATTAVGDLKVNLGERVKHYTELSKKLRSQAASKSLDIYVGGESDADKVSVENNTDRVKPAFTRKTHVNPNTQQGQLLRSDV